MARKHTRKEPPPQKNMKRFMAFQERLKELAVAQRAEERVQGVIEINMDDVEEKVAKDATPEP